ncbi:hypothetical protein ACJX0J_008810, partial [Zea mays]
VRGLYTLHIVGACRGAKTNDVNRCLVLDSGTLCYKIHLSIESLFFVVRKKSLFKCVMLVLIKKATQKGPKYLY